MSLIFRSVKKISRKKRKFGGKNKHNRRSFVDDFDDNPLKFVVDNEENYMENFPSLNSVYKTDIFGTPIAFQNVCGWDCMQYVKVKTKLQSIVFMNEYFNKSFEELRWEDYQCNRKGSKIFEQKNYSKCLLKDRTENTSCKWKHTVPPPKQYEFIEPIPKNIFGKFPALTRPKSLEIPLKEPVKIILSKISEESTNFKEESVTNFKEILRPNTNYKEIQRPKERSFLTNANTFYSNHNFNNTFFNINEVNDVEEFGNKFIPISRVNSELCIRQTKEDMVKENLEKFFSEADENASVPYEFFPLQNNYYSPCTNINLAYKNSRHSKFNVNFSNQPDYLLDLLKTNPFGYNSIFDKLEPIFEKNSLYERLYLSNDRNIPEENGDKKEKCSKVKYTSKNKFSKEYFQNQFSPYPSPSRKKLRSMKKVCKKSVEKVIRSKMFWMGLDVVT